MAKTAVPNVSAPATAGMVSGFGMRGCVNAYRDAAHSAAPAAAIMSAMATRRGAGGRGLPVIAAIAPYTENAMPNHAAVSVDGIWMNRGRDMNDSVMAWLAGLSVVGL